MNFRDLGGLPAAGGSVRSGLLYRSEGPASFGPVHREELQALGIRLVCDLRTDGERGKAPNDWSTTARLMNLDVDLDLRVRMSEGWRALEADPTIAGVQRAMSINYASIPETIRPFLAPLVEAIVDGETPLLVHCTAGKDRTGVLVALLLNALGVSHAAIVADYERSVIFAQNLRTRGGIEEQFAAEFGFRPDVSVIDATIGVDVAYLDAAFAAIDREYGSVKDYFTAAGIDTALLERFRATMLT